MTQGSVYLLDGLPLLIMGLGLFAVPEILDVLRHKTSISERGSMGAGWVRGVKDVFGNLWLVLRCSTIGSLIGALPGLGGTVIDWIAYGHVIQTTKDKSGFGKGDIRGVIAPESANNAKEGGALIPTLFLGIPGSGTMALLLGGLILIGVTPGRTLVTDRVDLVYVIIWSIALANVFGALICVGLARPIAALTTVPYVLIAPFMITLIFFAAFQTSQSWGDIVALAALGALGVFMKRFGWSRAALLIGFVLAGPLEDSVARTVQIYGFDIFMRPTAMIILALTVISIVVAWRARASAHMGEAETTSASYDHRRGQIIFALALLAFAVVFVLDTIDLRFLAYVFPVSVSVITGALILLAIGRISFGAGAALYDSEAEYRAAGGQAVSLVYYFGWFLLLPVITLFIGFFTAAPVFVAAFLKILGQRSWLTSAIGALAVAAGLAGLAELLALNYPGGWLTTALDTWMGR